MRKDGYFTIHAIAELEQQSAETLRAILENHHFWKND